MPKESAPHLPPDPIPVKPTEIGQQVKPLEGARVQRAVVLEGAQLALVLGDAEVVRSAQLRRKMWFLFGLVIVAFVLLAVRTEINTRANAENAQQIRQNLYDSCQSTAMRSEKINPGRVAVVELLIDITNTNTTLTDQQKADAIQVLRDGLILPPVNCGDAP